jgi:hypothetical protein
MREGLLARPPVHRKRGRSLARQLGLHNISRRFTWRLTRRRICSVELRQLEASPTANALISSRGLAFALTLENLRDREREIFAHLEQRKVDFLQRRRDVEEEGHGRKRVMDGTARSQRIMGGPVRIRMYAHCASAQELGDLSRIGICNELIALLRGPRPVKVLAVSLLVDLVH